MPQFAGFESSKPKSQWVKQVLLGEQEGEVLLGEDLHESEFPLGEPHAGPQLGEAVAIKQVQ